MYAQADGIVDAEGGTVWKQAIKKRLSQSREHRDG
jgi:hypothetical protein